MPYGHGRYRGLEFELLDPADEDELMLLLEAHHADLADALDSWDEVIVDGEPFSPRLRLAMHQIVANQLLADDPPETWQAVQRLRRRSALLARTRFEDAEKTAARFHPLFGLYSRIDHGLEGLCIGVSGLTRQPARLAGRRGDDRDTAGHGSEEEAGADG